MLLGVEGLLGVWVGWRGWLVSHIDIYHKESKKVIVVVVESGHWLVSKKEYQLLI